jgi:signal transduction histidine kinase
MGIALLYFLMLVLPSARPDAVRQELIERMGLLFTVLVLGLTGLSASLTAWSARGRIRWGWGTMAFAASVYFVGSIVYVFQAVDGTVDTFTGPLANIVYVIILPLTIVALLLLHPTHVSNWTMARIALDGLVIAGSILFLAWAAFIGEAYHASSADHAERILAVAYPVLSICLAAVAFILSSAAPSHHRDAFVLLGAGLIAFGIADAFTTYRYLQGNYVVGAATDAIFVVGLLLVVLSALRIDEWRGLPTHADARLGLFGAIFPIAPTAAGVVLAVYLTLEQGGLDQFHLIIGLGVVFLVLVRLTLVIVENDELTGRLRDTAQFKTDLLRFVSHEVANPLTPVKFQIALLRNEFQQRGIPPPEKNFEILSRNVSRLDLLTKDVLDLARLDVGRLAVVPLRVDLAQLAAQAVHAYEPQAEHKGVHLAFHATGSATVDADPRRIGQIIDNLLSNALKFTSRDGRIDVSLVPGMGEVGVKVKDTGVGLTPQQIEGLFHPFAQVHQDASDNAFAGHGLGLFISQQIAKLHGGRLVAESAGAGTGAEFTLWLPVAPFTPTDPNAIV